jgi:hypothetical protein
MLVRQLPLKVVFREKPPMTVGGFLFFFLHNVRIEKTMNTINVANPIIIERDSNTVIGITSHPLQEWETDHQLSPY